MLKSRFEMRSNEEVPFGEIAKQISKRVEPSTTDADVYYGLEHLDPENLRIKRWGSPAEVKGQKLTVKEGQIIFGKRRAYQRKLAVAPADGICSAHAMVLEANPKTIVPDLLPFFMQSDRFMERAVAISEGSLSPTIKWKTLATQKFPLPPKKRQEEILEVLQALEESLRVTEDAIASAVQLKRCLMARLLTKGIGHTKFKKTEIGELPVEWELVRVADTLAKKTRRGWSGKKIPDPNGIPVFSIAAVADGVIDLERSEHVTRSGDPDPRLKEATISVGDVLVIRGHANREVVGTCGLVTSLPDRCTYPDLLVRLVANSKVIPGYLAALINSPVGRRQVLAVAKTTSGIWKIDQRDIPSFLIPLPSRVEQQMILDAVSNMDLCLESVRRENENCRVLKQQVTTKLITR